MTAPGADPKIVEWARASTVEAIAERVQFAENEAFLWHLLSSAMTQDERERTQRLADTLRNGGYQYP